MKKVIAVAMVENMIKNPVGEDASIEMPDGCLGIMLVFKSKKSARAYFGKYVNLAELKEA